MYLILSLWISLGNYNSLVWLFGTLKVRKLRGMPKFIFPKFWPEKNKRKEEKWPQPKEKSECADRGYKRIFSYGNHRNI